MTESVSILLLYFSIFTDNTFTQDITQSILTFFRSEYIYLCIELIQISYEMVMISAPDNFIGDGVISPYFLEIVFLFL